VGRPALQLQMRLINSVFIGDCGDELRDRAGESGGNNSASAASLMKYKNGKMKDLNAPPICINLRSQSRLRG
jgi:hypothetical protein